MGHFSQQNYYEVLEIPTEATAEEIQKAFYKAKATYSPTSSALYSVFSEEEAKELLRLIDEAYSVLSNPAKRRDYDKSIFGLTHAPDPTPVAAVTSIKSKSMAEELPDFMLPDSEVSAPTTQGFAPSPSPTTTAKSSGPISLESAFGSQSPSKVGYGKTIMSHFNVDNAFEKEIEEQTVFDGTFLQKVRLYKNISIDQLSEVSRISRPYLLAVETNDFHSLPASVYVRGFISSVARLLGLPEKKVTDSYMKLFKDSRGNK